MLINIKNILKKFLACTFNIKITNVTKIEKFLLSNNNVKEYVEPNTMINFKRLSNILESIDYVEKNKIPGDYVECGVWRGGSVALSAIYMDLICVTGRSLHLFDAFGDICEPDHNIDGDRAIREVGGIENAQGRLQDSGLYKNMGLGISHVDEVKKLFKNIDFKGGSVNFHEGWFQETAPLAKLSIKEISILRLDGDWYESTKVCLDNLYSLVSKGGIIIVDDYDAYDGCKKAVDEFLHFHNINVIMNRIDTEAIFWIKDS